MKKKTHEEYVEELKVKNPTVEVVDEYVNAQTKIMHHCLKHDVYWEVLPVNALAGKGCKECMKEKNRNKFIKSHDTYVQQVKDISPHIDVLDEYIDSETPILHRCNKHHVEWMAYPGNILKGYGCKKCGFEKIGDKKRKKHDDYIKELSLLNPDVIALENYVNAYTPILHKCMKHNISWKITPSGALAGHGCPECHKERLRYSHAMSQEEYVERVGYVNPNVEVLGEYINISVPILHKCKIHDIVWMTSPNTILLGCGCYKCKSERISDKNRMEEYEYRDRLSRINPNIMAIDKYQDSKTQILHKCLIHNFVWRTSPASVLQGCGCPKCKSEKIGDKLRKTHDEYVLELKNINPNIMVIDIYVDIKTPIMHKCLIDGYTWKTTPASILSGTGCPKCNESKMERETSFWLDHNNILYERYMKFDGCVDQRQLSFDFYLPEFNTNIECQGIQHYEPIEYFGGEEAFKIQQRHDAIKRQYCLDNNIELLEIPYWENVENALNNFLFN